MAIDTTTALPCPSCGYDLRGQEQPRCPECGTPFDAEQLRVVHIPWEHRKQIGNFRAFVWTAALATFRTRRMRAHAAGPVNYRSARAFQLVVVWAMFVPLFISMIVVAFANQPIHELGTYSQYVTMPAGLFAFLLCATGVGSYFFHPRSLPAERRSRAVAISYYASAPGVIIVIGAAVFGFAQWCLACLVNTSAVQGALVSSYIVGTIGVVAAYWVGIQLLSQATECSRARLVAYALLVPLLQLFLAALFLVVLPVSFIFVELFCQSFI